MESLDNASKSSAGFFKHVFNFDEDSKGDLLNIIQYTVLAIVPIVIVNKVMQKYVPEANDDKGSLEIVAEVIFQSISMFTSIFFIHRMITYIPTYSGLKYQDFNVVYIILAMLMITMSLQTKLGEKVSILTERVLELWNGKPDTKRKKREGMDGNSKIKVSQPIVQGSGGMQMPQMQPPDNQQGTSIDMLPLSTGGQNNYNDMYRNDSTPLVNAQTPGNGMNEPVAASEAFGGGMFGGSMF